MSADAISRSPRSFRSVTTSAFRPTRGVVLIVAIVLLAAGVSACRGMGRFLAQEDPLAPADAIFVLAGTRVERPLEAADLYMAGYAPRIVLTRAGGEQHATQAAERRGAIATTELDAALALLQSLGVPETDVIVPGRVHDNTAEEAATLRDVAVTQGWRRVIVVSSPYHLRRTALACRRALRGTDIDILVRGTRYDTSTPDRWWRRRADIRWLASEVPKLLVYAIGAGG